MSQKKTLYSFFKSCQIPSEELSKDSTIAGQGSHSPKNGPGAKKGTLVSSYTPSPLCSASSRLNQMPRLSTKTDESNKTLGKRKAELKRAEEGPKLKQPRLEAEIEDRRVKLLQGLGDGTAQEANLREVQERFIWLNESQKRDAGGHRPTDKDYDQTSVKVPPETWKKLSASQKQYWEVKQHYQDTILFFRVGSFYELYEDDAQVGHDVLGWKMVLTGVGSCRQVGCASNGIDEAVARLTAAGYKVGRMEQLETAAEAKAKRGPKATIIRQLTKIQTPATATGALGADAVTLLALYECPTDYSNDSTALSQSMSAKFGFAFLDAAAGRYYCGHVTDDAGRTNLSAVLTQVCPKEVIYGRNVISNITARKLASPPVPLTLTPTHPTDFLEEEVQALVSGSSANSEEIFGGLRLPENMGRGEIAGLIALTAVVKHLQRLRAHTELITPSHMVVPYELYEAALMLDGPTLQNLDVLDHDGRPEGSLLAYLDNCSSAGGKRLLRVWLCRPLTSIDAINERLDAVDELRQKQDMVAEFRGSLANVRDLERMLGQVRNAANPPEDGLPDWVRHAAQQRRLTALNMALAGLEAAIAALNSLRDPKDGDPSSSKLLLDMISTIPADTVLDTLDKISTRLDVTEAKGLKKGAPKRQEVKLSQAFLEEQIRHDNDNEAKFIAEIAATTDLIAEFNSLANFWEEVEVALSTVDVLCSFAAFSENSDGATCRPEFVEQSQAGAVTDLQELWHPCALAGVSTRFVPNNVQLGTESDAARSLLLTGPNMGGKSTLLRATCIATIMAQIGCYVAAKSARLTPADRIFTRLGAQDRIVAGESTFLVECNEASTILRHATPQSLVVLDELGRGTSTFDGYAIAYAVLQFLSQKIDCRLMFATHYHSLTVECSDLEQIKLGHMAAKVPNADQQLDGMPCITFLYKLQPGACPQSYGLQVAELAGIPKTAILKAAQAGVMLEDKLKIPFQAAENLAQKTQIPSFVTMIKSLKTVSGHA